MKNQKTFTVTVELKEQNILRKNFMFLASADRWACKTVRKILVCGAVATIIDNRTGEIMGIIQR